MMGNPILMASACRMRTASQAPSWQTPQPNTNSLYTQQQFELHLPAAATHLCLKPPEHRRPLRPVAHALQAVHQVGKSLRKVLAQQQGALVGGDGRIVARCVLVRGCQVGMGLWGVLLQRGDLLVAGDGG